MGFLFVFSVFCSILLFLIALLVVWPTSRARRVSQPFSVSAWWVGALVTFCPIGGLLLCLGIAGTVHHYDAVKTHCGVANFWPSLSAAIGNNTPEIYIWRFAVALHNWYVFLDPLILYHHLLRHFAASAASGRASVSTSKVIGARLTAFFKSASAFSLFLLTFVSSSDNFAVHEAGFVLWLISASISMVLFAGLWRYGGAVDLDHNGRDRHTWFWLRFFLGSFFGLLVMAAFLYWWHNTFCTPYVYSFFGICEFLLVCSYVFGCGWGHWIAFDASHSRFVVVLEDATKDP